MNDLEYMIVFDKNQLCQKTNKNILVKLPDSINKIWIPVTKELETFQNRYIVDINLTEKYRTDVDTFLTGQELLTAFGENNTLIKKANWRNFKHRCELSIYPSEVIYRTAKASLISIRNSVKQVWVSNKFVYIRKNDVKLIFFKDWTYHTSEHTDILGDKIIAYFNDELHDQFEEEIHHIPEKKEAIEIEADPELKR